MASRTITGFVNIVNVTDYDETGAAIGDVVVIHQYFGFNVSFSVRALNSADFKLFYSALTTGQTVEFIVDDDNFSMDDVNRVNSYNSLRIIED